MRERDPYCNVHGRIRDMDSGASPFVDIAEVADQEMRKQGLSEEQIDQLNRENPAERSELGRRLAREASESDARRADPFAQMADAMIDQMDGLKNAIPPGCKCLWRGSQPTAPYEVSRRCPIHYPLSVRLREEGHMMRERGWGFTSGPDGYPRERRPGTPVDWRLQLMRETQTGYMGDAR